jgi:hypothetical protein
MKNQKHKCFLVAVILQVGFAVNLSANDKSDTLQLDAKQKSLVAISALAGKGDQVLCTGVTDIPIIDLILPVFDTFHFTFPNDYHHGYYNILLHPTPYFFFVYSQ